MPVLSEQDYRTWAEEGVELAGHSLRSWEAAAEYYRVSAEVMRALPSAAFRRWAHASRDLAEYSSVVAAAYLKASPQGVPFLGEDQLVEWAALGQRLYKGHWKSISLASGYFGASPGLLATLTLRRDGAAGRARSSRSPSARTSLRGRASTRRRGCSRRWRSATGRRS